MANKVKNIQIDKIFIDDNRLWKIYDKDLEPLLESIKEEGLITPIAVQERNGKYKLIAGEHRLTCCKKLDWTEIPAHIIEREYEDDEIEDARLTILEADENLKRKDPDFIAEAHMLAKRKEAYDKVMAFKCNGMKPEDYKNMINGKIQSKIINSTEYFTEKEVEELKKLDNDLVNIKTFTQDTMESSGLSASNITSKLKFAKYISEDDAEDIKNNNISFKTVQAITTGKNEVDVKKASEIHLETLKDINDKIDNKTNINTIYKKAINETKKRIDDKDFHKNNPIEFAAKVAEKVHEVIELEEKKKQNKVYQLSQDDLDDINIALAMLENISDIVITVDGRTIFEKTLEEME